MRLLNGTAGTDGGVDLSLHPGQKGPVEILSLPEAMEPLVDYYRSISGEHPDWDDYRAAMVRDQRVLLAITPQRAGPTSGG